MITDILLSIIIVLIIISTAVLAYGQRFAINPKRVALSIYIDIVTAVGTDNLTPERARIEAQVRFAKMAELTGYPMKARAAVIKRVIELTREEVTPIKWNTIEDNIT